MKYLFFLFVLLTAASCGKLTKKKYYLVRTFKEYELLSSTRWNYSKVKDSFYAPNDIAAYDTAVLTLYSRVATETMLRTKYPNNRALFDETTDVDVYDELGRLVKYLIPQTAADSIEKKWNDQIFKHSANF